MIEQNTEDKITNSQNQEEVTKADIVLQALEKDSENSNTAIALVGIVGAIGLTAVINPVFGGIVLALVTGGAAYRQTMKGVVRRKVLSGEVSPIVLMNDADAIADYKQVIGEENFVIELKQVGDSYKMLPESTQNVIKSEQFAYAPQINPIEELADYFDKNCMILGVSGDGKDFLVSNAVRLAKAQNPQLNIFVIDPKGDRREAPYYKDIVTAFRSQQCGEVSDEKAISWFKGAYEEYREMSANPDEQWLLIISETTLIGEAFKRGKDNYLEEVVSKQVTTGGSFGKYMWVLSQTPVLANLGFGSGSRMQFATFAVVHRKSCQKVSQWVRTQVVAKIKKSDLEILCDRSQVKRCFYCPGTGEWHIMPKLTNYSTFDRDTRTRIQPTSTPTSPTIVQTTTPTKLQDKNPQHEAILLKLEEVNTCDILEAVKTIFPDIPNNKLTQMVNTIKQMCVTHGKQNLISKFSL